MESKKQLRIWTRHKNKLIKGKKCANCEKSAETMHHPKPRSDYISFEEYLNERNLTPVCHWCHHTVFHGRNPYHMRWSRCHFRSNEEIRILPEYKQKQIIYKDFYNKCELKQGCLAVPIAMV